MTANLAATAAATASGAGSTAAASLSTLGLIRFFTFRIFHHRRLAAVGLVGLVTHSRLQFLRLIGCRCWSRLRIRRSYRNSRGCDRLSLLDVFLIKIEDGRALRSRRGSFSLGSVLRRLCFLSLSSTLRGALPSTEENDQADD